MPLRKNETQFYYAESECSMQEGVFEIDRIDQKTRSMPEQKLFYAVLLQATRDAKALHELASRKKSILSAPLFQQEVHAIADFFQPPATYPSNIEYLCSYLDIDAENIQERVMKRYLSPLLKRIKVKKSTFH